MSTGRFVPAHAVDRPDLRRKLDVALERALTLVVAPAGAGKSVLLTQWINSHPEVGCVWIDVATADNDPVRFVRHMLHALATVSPEFEGLAPLGVPFGGGLGLPIVVALAARLTELGETVMVLDDLHHLSTKAIITDLGRLIEIAPPNVHVVLSSRVDLPIAWTRNRMRNEVSELRQAELAMNHQQSAELLRKIAGVELDAAEVDVLVDRTEGWVAGLQLAGMTIRLRPDPAEFIAQFGGSDRLVADYLSEEVLQALPPQERTALLAMSVLDQMSVELLAHVSSASVARQLLVQLDKGGIFLIPTDDLREWFRFHHLFRDLLRFRIRLEVPGAEARILTSAAAWHLRRGESGPAIDYLLRAHEWEAAIEAILGRGDDVLELREAATVVQWITAIPDSVRSARTDIALLLAIITEHLGYSAKAEDMLREVVAKPDLTPVQEACAHTFLAALAPWRPNPEVFVERAERALGTIAKIHETAPANLVNLTDPRSLEAVALISGGRAHFFAGNFAASRRWLERGLTSEGAQFSSWRIGGLGSLALLEAWCGHTVRAEELAREVLGIGQDTGKSEHPATADAHLANAWAAIERAQTSRAKSALREGSSRAQADHRTQLTWIAESARVALGSMHNSPAPDPPAPLPPPPPIAQEQLLAMRARTYRLAGSANDALHMLEGVPSSWSATVFERAAAQLSLGHVDASRSTIEKLSTLRDREEPLARVRRMILGSWKSAVLGLDNRAAVQLAEALREAEPEGLVDVFVGSGSFIVGQISLLIDGPAPALRQAILDQAAGILIPLPRITITEPLTNREKDLVALLPSRLSNEELADRFCVSVNTIKTHLAHIYRKLDAGNRRAAIQRATEIGLLR